MLEKGSSLVRTGCRQDESDRGADVQGMVKSCQVLMKHLLDTSLPKLSNIETVKFLAE